MPGQARPGTTADEKSSLTPFSHSPDDPRNARSKAFADEKYKGGIAPSGAAGLDAVARGGWSSAAEDASFWSGVRRYSAARLFLVMFQHELQRRLGLDAALRDVSVLGVDPGTMVSGLQRLAPWFIRVVLFKVVYPFVLWLKPEGGPVRSPARSAGDVLEAAVGAVGVEGGLPKDLYFDGRVPLETSAESRDVEKRKLVWAETVRYAGLKEGDTVLGNWQ